MKAIFTALLLFETICSFGQNDYVSKQLNPFMFYNHQRGKFTVIDDSTGCREYNDRTKNWEFRPLTFQLEESFSRFLVTYNVLHEKGSEIFFVDKGCGVVYVLKNDTVKRHDRSTHQANQYRGTFFLYMGMPHIFGGYGLFQYKNILTRYDVLDREWFCYDVDGSKPMPRIDAYGKIEKDNFYLVGGLTGDTKPKWYTDDVWKFNFKTRSWKKIGRFNELDTTEIQFHEYLKTSINSPLILRSDRFFYPFFATNYLRVFRLFQKEKIYNVLINKGQCFVYKVHSDNLSSEFCVVDSASFFKECLYKGSVIKKDTENSSVLNALFWVVPALTLLFGINYLFFFRSRRKKLEFLLTDNEQTLLSFFMDSASEGLEISMINDLVSHDSPSLDTMKKRRENLLREFRNKLATHFKMDAEVVFIEEKHPTDKRIKILKLHPKITDKLHNQTKGK